MEINRTILKAVLDEVNQTKQYEMNEYGYYTEIQKTWNNGMGRLSLLRICEEEKIILINMNLWNKADQRHFDNIASVAPEIKNYQIIKVYYGYPTYYNNSMCISLYKSRRGLIHKDSREVFDRLFPMTEEEKLNEYRQW